MEHPVPICDGSKPSASAILRSPRSRTRRLRIIFLEPPIGKLWRREYLEVVDAANLLVGIDVNPDGFHGLSSACASPNACRCDQD
jgi:hypothetical protein